MPNYPKDQALIDRPSTWTRDALTRGAVYQPQKSRLPSRLRGGGNAEYPKQQPKRLMSRGKGRRADERIFHRISRQKNPQPTARYALGIS
jgi:hypothetical protein